MSRRRGRYGEYFIRDKLEKLVPGSSCLRIPVSGCKSFPGDLFWNVSNECKVLVEVKTRSFGRGIRRFFNFFGNLSNKLNMKFGSVFPIVIKFSNIALLYVPFRPNLNGLVVHNTDEVLILNGNVEKWYCSIKEKAENKYLPMLVMKYHTSRGSSNKNTSNGRLRGAMVCIFPVEAVKMITGGLLSSNLKKKVFFTFKNGEFLGGKEGKRVFFVYFRQV